jgi:hypothetical protein
LPASAERDRGADHKQHDCDRTQDSAITDWSPERTFLGPFRDVFAARTVREATEAHEALPAEVPGDFARECIGVSNVARKGASYCWLL